MTRNEYIDILKDILSQVQNKAYVDTKMDLIRNYRPQSVLVNDINVALKLQEPEKHSNFIAEFTGVYTCKNIYPGVEETLNLIREAYQYRKSTYNVARIDAMKDTMKNDFSYYEQLGNVCDIGEDFSFATYKSLYASHEVVAFVLYYISFDREKLQKLKVTEFKNYYDYANIGIVMNDFIYKTYPYLLIKNGFNGKLIDLVSDRLNKCGKTVYIYDGELDELGDFINEICGDKTQINIVATGEDLNYLSVVNPRKYRKLVNSDLVTSNHTLSYGKYCDYISYISDLYMEDVGTLVQTEPQVKFSILIPARNSAQTLRYTLETCLNQSYIGNYEIVVSDNSTDVNSEVLELCRTINSDKIKYIKTPRNLHLPKSFEFGYLHTRGEYILSLGADDGLLPWALEELDKIISQYPNEEIIQWERGFYAWPGFNKGQQNQFTVARAYSRNNYHIYYKEGLSYLAEVMMKPENMYSLPMLYINSCFKRTYLGTLLNKIGCLWDGVCQDIFMGVITAATHKKILNVEFPMSIAGMSNASVGALANRSIYNKTELDKAIGIEHIESNVGGYCRSLYEQYVPFTGTDTASLYTSILRAIHYGIIPTYYIEKVIPWQLWYTNLADEMSILDITFERKINEMRYHASFLGEEFLEWFDKNIYEPRLQPVLIDNKKLELYHNNFERSYKVGKNDNGGRTLDASEFGVNNIAEAVKLFCKIIEE